MPRYWVVRTDDGPFREEVIVPSLDAGELRQGWGWDADQDLDVIGPIVTAEGRSGLNDRQKATWRRVQRFWPEHWGPVCEGDLILLPKVPSAGHWRMVRVTSRYRYEPSEISQDHGHVLPVETLIPEIANSNRAVGAGLRRTMSARQPMWNIDGLAGEIERIRQAAVTEPVSTHDDDTTRMQEVLDETLTELLERIRRSFRANQLEAPVHQLLQQVFPQGDVQRRTGPAEHGADFVVSQIDPFGHEQVTVIQLKDHPGVLDDRHALEQIREASRHYTPTAGVVLTTATVEDAGFANARQELEEELGIPVSAILGRQLAALFLANLEALSAE